MKRKRERKSEMDLFGMPMAIHIHHRVLWLVDRRAKKVEEVELDDLPRFQDAGFDYHLAATAEVGDEWSIDDAIEDLKRRMLENIERLRLALINTEGR